MAIVKMKKFKLFALEKDRKALLKELQKFDYVHFIKTSNEENEYLKEVELPENINLLKEKSQKVKWMKNFLLKLFPKEAKEEISNMMDIAYRYKLDMHMASPAIDKLRDIEVFERPVGPPKIKNIEQEIARYTQQVRDQDLGRTEPGRGEDR